MRRLKHNKREPFTEPLTSDEQEQVKKRAYAIWQSRKDSGRTSSEDDWHEAIGQLKDSEPFSSRSMRIWKWFWERTGFKGKTLWDWFQLLVVPLTLALVGSGLQEFTKYRDQQLADDRAKQETLVKYQAEMSELLQLGLLDSSPNSKEIVIAQAKTVITLLSLDAKRQNLVIQFLDAANLNRLNRYGILHQARMSKADLRGSDLSGAVLVGADLSSSNFSCLSPTSFQESERKCSVLIGVNLNNSILKNADLRNANISGANLQGANLQGANLQGVRFRGNNIQNAELSEINLSRANLEGTNFSDASLYKANLSNAFLYNAKLQNANLHSANLEGANLYDADLQNADLYLSNLSGADLQAVKLQNAKLIFASLDSAHLYYTDLQGADLSGAYFNNANLDGANLQSAILLATDLVDSKNLVLDQLISKDPPFLCATKLPPGMENLSDRDCNRLVEELVRRFPNNFETFEQAKQYITSFRNR